MPIAVKQVNLITKNKFLKQLKSDDNLILSSLFSFKTKSHLMLLYLLLFIISGIAAVIFLGIGIYALIKKKKQLAITSVIVFALSCVATVSFVVMYAKKTVAYVSSNEFQMDVKNTAEAAGKTAGNAASGASKGLAETLSDKDIEALAQKTGSIIGKVVKATASGLDSTVNTTSIFTAKSMEATGITLGRADVTYASKAKRDVTIFMDFKNNFKGKLQLTNYDQTGKKIDAITTEVNEKAGAGKVIVFSFTYSDVGITTYSILEKL